MTEEDFKRLLKEATDSIIKRIDGVNERVDGVAKRVDGVTERLDDPETGLQRANKVLDANTESIVNIEQTIKGYSDMYKMNNDNIKKFDKRLNIAEEELGINPPSELVLGEV